MSRLRRLGLTIILVAWASGPFQHTMAGRATAALPEQTLMMYHSSMIDPATITVGYDVDNGHYINFSAPGVSVGLAPPTADETFTPGVYTVRDDGTTPWIRDSPCTPGSTRRIEILQFEASGDQLLHFAARTSTVCPELTLHTVVAYRATVPLDVVTRDSILPYEAVARIGETVAVPITVHNAGTTVVHPSLAVPPSSSLPGLGSSLGTSAGGLAPGGSCVVELTWSPTAVGSWRVAPTVVGEFTSWSGPVGIPTGTMWVAGRPAPPPGDGFEAIAPIRLLDTRFGVGVASPGPIDQQAIRVQLGGLGGVPSDATAVLANVTVTEPTTAGFLTLSPSGVARPDVSNLNFVASETAANSSLLTLGEGGGVDVFNSSGRSHVLIDVVGWLSPFADLVYVPKLTPTRVLDTRDPQSDPRGAVGPGEVRLMPTAHLGIENGAAAVVVNITGTEPTAATHLTAFGATLVNGPPPNVSTLNLRAGQTRANLAVVSQTDGRRFGVFNNAGSTHVVVDVMGYFVPSDDTATRGRIIPLVPFRATDTRATSTAFQPHEAGGYRFPPTIGTPPIDVAGIIFNATVTEPTHDGYLTMFPWDSYVIPVVSNLNFVAGQTIPNQAWVRLATEPDNLVGLLNGSPGSTHVVLDVQGVVLG